MAAIGHLCFHLFSPLLPYYAQLDAAADLELYQSDIFWIQKCLDMVKKTSNDKIIDAPKPIQLWYPYTVPSWKPCFLVDWRPLDKECIANID